MEKTKQVRTRKSTKFVFTLKNINIEKVDQKYGITLISNINTTDDIPPINTTTITELTETAKDTSLDIISFLDETKRIYQCNISMIDFISGNNTEKMKGYNCYWCKNSFNSIPIGCPINYVSSKVIKKYHSEVSKDDYIIKENITKYKRKLLENTDLFVTKNKAEINIKKDEYYETDGIFCSFNCCKAFIKDNKHNNLYERSDNLLIMLYKDMNSDLQNFENVKINPAPSWRLLKEYGGYMTIDQFRKNFNKCSYEFKGYIKYTSLFKPLGNLYEEKINF